MCRVMDYVNSYAGHDLFNDILAAGMLTYIDKQEERSLVVAPSPYEVPPGGWAKYTHCEIDPSMLLGLCGSCIPFAHFNQSPRNTYQCAMMKQALGVHTTRNAIRMDTIAYSMMQPQRPIVTTRMEQYVAGDAAAGVNCITCIMCYTGYNQEDSLIINKGAIDRGLFQSIKFQTVREEEEQHGGTDAQQFQNASLVPQILNLRDANYNHLTDAGVVAVGTHVEPNDVLVSKTVTSSDVGEGSRRNTKSDKSTIQRHESGIVDSVMTSRNADGTHITKIRIRKTRSPVVGDKLSSRMGQKGVIGRIVPQEDMPFTEDGIVPDLILNPHAIPSRMTIGQLVESLLAILCTVTGKRGDGTAFRAVTIDQISKCLEEAGCDPCGRVKLRCGLTGEAFESRVFMAPTYYQRLKHHSGDKFHARSRGPVNLLSRQPTEGRSRDGGLRFGEMERDTLIAHGSAWFLKDRLLDNSDPSLFCICATCGLPAQPAAQGTRIRNVRAECTACGGNDIREMQTPFAFQLLVQELQAMNIRIKFEF